MRRWLAILVLLCPALASATTTVTGTLQNLGTGTVGQGAFVRFWLRGCGGNIPRINGTAVIAPSQGGVYYFDIAANSSGAISGTLYSTRDSTGVLAGDIECGGSKLAVWYGMQIFVGGKGGSEIPIHAKNGVTLDITQVTPLTTNPVIAAPSGDSTYLRLDGGNSPVTGNIAFIGTDTFKNINTFRYVDSALTTFASVQAAINDLPAAGGTVWIQCGGSYTAPTSIPSGVALRSTCPGASGLNAQPYTTTLNYAAGQTIGPARGIAIENLNLSFSGANALTFSSIQQSYFDMSVTCATGSPCVIFTATNAGGNTTQNRWDYLNVTTGGAIGFQLTGDPPVLGAGGYTTVNDFRTVVLNMTRSTPGAITRAIGFTQNCDSNHFGSVHIFLTNVTSGNGIVFNDSATPAAETGADNEVIDLVDFTFPPTVTGTAFTVNKSTGVKWTEGFGQSGFSTTIAADATTNFIRETLNGSAISLGNMNIVMDPGATFGNIKVPLVSADTLMARTLAETVTGQKTFSFPPIVGGTAAGLTGTGACATITTQHGGAWGGDAKCTGATAASTLTITPGITAPTGWACHVQDQTTRANLFQQTSSTQTTCVLTVTSVTQNDVFVFLAVPY